MATKEVVDAIHEMLREERLKRVRILTAMRAMIESRTQENIEACERILKEYGF